MKEIPGSNEGVHPLLAAHHLAVHYGSALALEDVSLQVEQGECLAILGRNGMGKTTLMSALVGFLPPSRGRIEIRGRDTTRLPTQEIVAAGLAIVPQGRRVFGSLTVLENLRVVAQGTASTDVRFSLDDVLGLFPRLAERRGQFAENLSGGEQQMLAIARALMTNPALLLLDEPTEGLAPIIIQKLSEAFAELRTAGLSMLLTEQRVPFALELADRVLGMRERGEFFFSGPPDQYAAAVQQMQFTDQRTSNGTTRE